MTASNNNNSKAVEVKDNTKSSKKTKKEKALHSGESKTTVKKVSSAKTNNAGKAKNLTEKKKKRLSKTQRRRKTRVFAQLKKNKEAAKEKQQLSKTTSSKQEKSKNSVKAENTGEKVNVPKIDNSDSNNKNDSKSTEGSVDKKAALNSSKTSKKKSKEKSKKKDKVEKELVSTTTTSKDTSDKGVNNTDSASVESKPNKKRKRKSKSKTRDKQEKKPLSETNSQDASSNNDDKAIENGLAVTDSNKSSKKRKGPKAKSVVSGSSNWKVLCSEELKADPYVRKTHEAKKPEEEEEPPAKKAKQEIWFDVDESMLMDESKDGDQMDLASSKSLVKEQSFSGKTKCIGMDCEMVGTGKDGDESILARVSLVNIYGHCLYDKYVLPREKVTDYRTHVSGVTKELVAEKGEPFLKVQKEVSDIIQGGVLVGHALNNDLKVLFLSHPRSSIRDTSNYKPFRELFEGQKPSLKKLTAKLLGVKVQEGEHSSVEDAQAAMRLYTMHRKKWDKELKDVHRMVKKKKDKVKKKKVKDENEQFES